MKAIETIVEQIPLKDISVVANARTDMDAKKLAELKHTIIEGGIRTPLVLAPLKVAGTPIEGKFRIVCGHRRFAAATDLELETVPAIVRDLSDDEIEVEQLVENDAREDLTALDRAAQYKKLQERGLDAAAISKRVGRARSTVELTLRLADLVDAGKKALRDGWLPQGAAEELALLSPAVQKDGLKLLEQLDQDGDLTRDKARDLLRRELLLDLAEVKFDTRDATLVPAAGACIPDCTKRTGAQPDLFGGGKGPDCCTDRPCLRVKEGAWLRLQEKAGVKVLSSAEAKQVFPYDHANSVDRDSGYALADEKDYHHPQSKTYRAQLGKEAKTKVVLARGPDGALVELVARKDLPKPETSSSSSSTKQGPSAAEKRRALEQKAARETVSRALTEITQHLAGGKLGQYDADVAELAFRALLRESHKDTKVALARLLLLEPAKGYDGADVALLAHYEATEKKRKHPGWDFVVAMALAPALLSNPIYPDQGALNDLKKFLKLTGAADFTKLRGDVERGYREAEKAKAARKVGAKTAKRKTAARTATLPELEAAKLEQLFERRTVRVPSENLGDLTGTKFGEQLAKHAAKVQAFENCGAVDGRPGKKNGACIMSASHDGAHSNGYRTWPPKKLERPTEPTDPIQWLPKKHPKIVAVGLGHDGRRYEVLREKRHDSKAIGFFWRGGKGKEFTAPGDGWGSIVDTEEKAKAGAEEHEARAAEKAGAR